MVVCDPSLPPSAAAPTPAARSLSLPPSLSSSLLFALPPSARCPPRYYLGLEAIEDAYVASNVTGVPTYLLHAFAQVVPRGRGLGGAGLLLCT